MDAFKLTDSVETLRTYCERVRLAMVARGIRMPMWS